MYTLCSNFYTTLNEWKNEFQISNILQYKMCQFILFLKKISKSFINSEGINFTAVLHCTTLQTARLIIA